MSRDRAAEAKVFEEVLHRFGMLQYVGSDPYRPGGAEYRIGTTTVETIIRVCEEMQVRCGWSFEDTTELIDRVASASEPAPTKRGVSGRGGG